MTVFDDLHVRALHAMAKGGPLYVTEAEQAELDEADPYLIAAVAASAYDIQVDDTKAAAQAKTAAKAYVPPVEPDLPGVTI